MDADCRPERMTAIVDHELARYNIAVAALSETRRADTGCVKEMGAGYTFFSAVIIIFHLEQIATEIISPQCIYL